MIIVRNEKLVKRNKQIGRFSSILAVVTLVAGMYLSYRYQQQITYSLLALVFGFTLSQIGIAYSNRFVRSPRPDEELDIALKGLEDQYVLYHYQSPVPHLLVGPAGVWMLLPYSQKGKIIYDDKKKRWKKIGGNAYLRFFAQETIGNPQAEISSGLKSIRKSFQKIPQLEIPPIQAALVFSGEGVVVEAEDAPYPTLHALQLKKLIRKEAKGEFGISTPVRETIQDHLGRESLV